MAIGFLDPQPLQVSAKLAKTAAAALRLVGLDPLRVPMELIAGAAFLLEYIGIALTIALPEELLFRSVIQNLLEKTFGWRPVVLWTSALIFGAAHLNNGALGWQASQWNWNYFLLATIAGTVYGLVYRYTQSLWFPVALHALVDVIGHTCFTSYRVEPASAWHIIAVCAGIVFILPLTHMFLKFTDSTKKNVPIFEIS